MQREATSGNQGDGAMTKLEAGSAAKAGYYFNLSSLEIHPVRADGEALPGKPGSQWVSIPVAAALVLAPVLGLTFLMFVPFIGIYLTAERALKPLFHAARKEAGNLAATMSPGWRPGEAHLTGKREEGKAAEAEPEPGAELDQLAREIEAKRAGKK
jgi:hypothetical protein